MSRRIVIPVVAAVVVAVAVAGWFFWLRADEPRPTTFRTEPTSAFYAAIDSRQSDSKPLTTQEVFTSATQNLGGLRLEATRQFTDCDEILWGASAPGCTQALQATYKGGAVAGQFVIFNLSDGHAADALVTALSKDGFVRQDIAFEPVGSLAQARAMGHYVTVSWAGGTAPATDSAQAAADSGQPPAPAQDVVTALVAMDGLGRVVQGRIVAAT